VDLTDWNATKEAIKPHLPIQYLVNNAAMAILDPFLEAKSEDFDLYVKNIPNMWVSFLIDYLKIIQYQCSINHLC
jgi:NADP-dependent 3-hydroxy acid dehydrogenase YdfG